MKKLLLFLILTLSASGVSNAQWMRPITKARKGLRTTQQGGLWQSTKKLEKVIKEQVRKSQSTLQSVAGDVSRSRKVPPNGGVLLPHTSSTSQRTHSPAGWQRIEQRKETEVRFENVGFIPHIHSTPPTKAQFGSDYLFQEIQRQEILSKEHDKLRDRIYKSLNKLNSTEWESTITGHIIYYYENGFEYIPNAA